MRLKLRKSWFEIFSNQIVIFVNEWYEFVIVLLFPLFLSHSNWNLMEKIKEETDICIFYLNFPIKRCEIKVMRGVGYFTQSNILLLVYLAWVAF